MGCAISNYGIKNFAIAGAAAEVAGERLLRFLTVDQPNSPPSGCVVLTPVYADQQIKDHSTVNHPR
jgi:hypothetical protein